MNEELSKFYQEKEQSIDNKLLTFVASDVYLKRVK